MAIHIHLDELLEEHGMLLKDLAAATGISVVNLSRLKTGKVRAVRFSTLEALCKALCCQPGDLLAFAPQRDRERPPTTLQATPRRKRAG